MKLPNFQAFRVDQIPVQFEEVTNKIDCEPLKQAIRAKYQYYEPKINKASQDLADKISHKYHEHNMDDKIMIKYFQEDKENNPKPVIKKPKYNFFSAIDEPVDLMIKNLTGGNKQNQS